MDDIKIEKWTAKAERFGKNGINLIFINYNSSLGIGNIVPIPIGQFKNRELFLNYRIYSIEKCGKHIHYTFYLGKEVNNGK